MIPCPEKYRAETCPPDFESVGVLTAHLVTAHLVSSSVAFPEARATFGKVDVTAPPDRPAAPQPVRAVAVVAPPPPPESTAPKETPMADLSKTCKGCRKPFTRTHHLQKTCEACRGNKCTTCHREGGGHTPSCPKASGKASAKKPTGGGARQSSRRPPKPEPAVANGNGAGKTAAYIIGLVQAVAAGKAAEVELAGIREALGG